MAFFTKNFKTFCHANKTEILQYIPSSSSFFYSNKNSYYATSLSAEFCLVPLQSRWNSRLTLSSFPV